jgi:hypothetical protein
MTRNGMMMATVLLPAKAAPNRDTAPTAVKFG